ncbi:hypothetical protein [Sulfodiicoccus acidiphilus]|nr:hypothetical protein [Sulfodiicoccus acidiphilus]
MLSDVLEKELKGLRPELSEEVLEGLLRDLSPSEDLPSEVRRAQEEIVIELALSLFDLRLGRTIEGDEVVGLDSQIFGIVRKLRELYAKLLSGQLLYSKGRILCRLEKNLVMDGKDLSKGDLLLVEVGIAFPLVSAGYLTPYSSTTVN